MMQLGWRSFAVRGHGHAGSREALLWDILSRIEICLGPGRYRSLDAPGRCLEYLVAHLQMRRLEQRNSHICRGRRRTRSQSVRCPFASPVVQAISGMRRISAHLSASQMSVSDSAIAHLQGSPSHVPGGVCQGAGGETLLIGVFAFVVCMVVLSPLVQGGNHRRLSAAICVGRILSMLARLAWRFWRDCVGPVRGCGGMSLFVWGDPLWLPSFVYVRSWAGWPVGHRQGLGSPSGWRFGVLALERLGGLVGVPAARPVLNLVVLAHSLSRGGFHRSSARQWRLGAPLAQGVGAGELSVRRCSIASDGIWSAKDRTGAIRTDGQ